MHIDTLIKFKNPQKRTHKLLWDRILLKIEKERIEKENKTRTKGYTTLLTTDKHDILTLWKQIALKYGINK